jgi:hypothetical protein
VAGLTASSAWAGPVSATPGTIQGVITFNAPFVPTSMEVDARDSSNQYTATANAVQNDPANCAPGSPNWCYSIIVESALANAYYLRPIAWNEQTSPIYIYSRAPFPPTTLVAITAGATVAYNISYTPGEISGTVSGNDMNSQPLQVSSVYDSFWDLSNTYNEPCGGSIEFCPFNTVYQGGAPALPALATYQDFLKPGDSYDYLTRAVGFQESGGATTEIQFNDSLALGTTPAAGTNVIQNYALNQNASISGNISAPGQSIYNYQVTAQGYTTTTGGAWYENFGPTNISPTPLGQPLIYTARLFDFTDYTQPIYVSTLLTLSPNGTTYLQYPPTVLTPAVTPGQQATLNFSGTAASISGRVTFSPPYPAGNIYPGIQAETQTPAGGIGSAATQLTTDALGGTYTLPAFGGNWQYWRFGWNFTLSNPNFTSNYLVGQFLTVPVPVTDGQNLTGNNFTFETALVRVLFTAPTGTTITDPQLAITTGGYTGTTFAPDYVETGNAEGLGFNSVLNAESDAVLRVHGVPFQLTPSAIINPGGTPGTGRTTFSPIVLNPNQGDIIIVGIPGSLSLTVSSPQNGATVSSCPITVTGTSTGAPDITITVNGQSASTSSTGNPNDPNQVQFTASVPCAGGSTPITVVSSAPGNTSVSYTLTVTSTSLSTTTTVQSSANPSVYGQPVTFTANVSTTGSSTPTGTVTFLDGTTTLGTGNLSGGVAMFVTSSLSVGSHSISASYGGSSSFAASASGALIQLVNPAPLVITAGGGTMSYGGTVPAITPSYSGFVPGESAANLNPQPLCTTTATSTSNLGSYPTSCSGAADPNYSISYKNGTLTVTPAVLTVTATSQTDVYGSVDGDNCGKVNQHLTYTITGFVDGQTRSQVLTGSPDETTTAEPKSNVGTYAIDISQGTLQLNSTLGTHYTLVFVNGTLTVTPATLTVIANSYSRPVNWPNPSFGYNIFGFVNGDNQWNATTGKPACCTTTATQSSPAGNYTITLGPGNLAANHGNYTITLVNGVLIVFNPKNPNDPHCDGFGNFHPNPQYDCNNWPDKASYGHYWGNGGHGPTVISWP